MFFRDEHAAMMAVGAWIILVQADIKLWDQKDESPEFH